MKKRILLLIILIILVLSSIKPCYKLVMKALYPLRYDEYIVTYSGKYDLDKYLVMALIKAESNYIYDAHSGVARGLMQITDETASWIATKLSLGKFDILNSETNINMGCYYLSYLLDYYKDNEQLALAAYNAGMGNVNKWLSDKEYSQSGETLDNIPFKETRQYIDKIEKNKEIYIKLYKKEEEWLWIQLSQLEDSMEAEAKN